MIERNEMQEMAKKFKDPKVLILGSHSALDAAAGARNYDLPYLIYTTPQRAIIYLQNPMVGKSKEVVDDLPAVVRRDMVVVKDIADLKKKKFAHAILILDKYSDIVKFVDDLVDLECLQIPNRAFSVYVGGDEKCSVIENDFAVPIVGSRKLLKIENRGEIEKELNRNNGGIKTGSVKDLEILSRPEDNKMGIGRFHFSDRYSVFDWGEMPDHLL
ncbi:unnamed protein product, partial [marine sediment metagenome]